jgi:hypothetical protein
VKIDIARQLGPVTRQASFREHQGPTTRRVQASRTPEGRARAAAARTSAFYSGEAVAASTHDRKDA